MEPRFRNCPSAPTIALVVLLVVTELRNDPSRENFTRTRAKRSKFRGNDPVGNHVYTINKAASLRAATLSPTNQPRTETPSAFLRI